MWMTRNTQTKIGKSEPNPTHGSRKRASRGRDPHRATPKQLRYPADAILPLPDDTCCRRLPFHPATSVSSPCQCSAAQCGRICGRQTVAEVFASDSKPMHRFDVHSTNLRLVTHTIRSFGIVLDQNHPRMRSRRASHFTPARRLRITNQSGTPMKITSIATPAEFVGFSTVKMKADIKSCWDH